MSRILNKITIRASADKTWGIVGDLDSVVKWVPGITTCRLEGAMRICNNGEIQEQISAFSAQDRSYRFRHARVPLPVQNSRGKFSVRPKGRDAIVTLEWEFEPLDPVQEKELTRMVDGAAKQTLEMLRTLVEEQA